MEDPMTRRNVFIALVVGVFALGGWAWAQTRVQGPPPAVSGGGPFAVSPVGQSAILVDASSGKTWELTHSVDGQAVWLPGKRIDSEKEAEEWRHHERDLRKKQDEENKLRERERALLEQLKNNQSIDLLQVPPANPAFVPDKKK